MLDAGLIPLKKKLAGFDFLVLLFLNLLLIYIFRLRSFTGALNENHHLFLSLPFKYESLPIVCVRVYFVLLSLLSLF